MRSDEYRSLRRYLSTAIAMSAAFLLGSGCRHRDGGTSPAVADDGPAVVSSVGGDAAASVSAAASASDSRVATMPSFPPPPDLSHMPASAETTPSGLGSVVLKPGIGRTHPRRLDLVTFRFVAWNPDGKVAGASSEEMDGPPVASRVGEAASPGLSEALQLMVAGEKRRLWIPAAIASSAEPGTDLVIDAELVSIVPTPEPPGAPMYELSPPRKARATGSGLKWRVVTSGPANAPRARPDDIVVYNFTLWTATGALVNSSFPLGRPESQIASRLPQPFGEALQLLRVGDTVRLWFDEEQGAPPGGPYIADIQLIYVYPLTS